MIAEVGVYHAPKLLLPPTAKRSTSGEVTLTAPDTNLELYYTLDGSNPTKESQAYSSPIPVNEATTLMASSFDPATGKMSDPVRLDLDLPKAGWKAIGTAEMKAIDENSNSYFTSENGMLTIDLGEKIEIQGFSYMPMQARYPSGIITNFEFQVSEDGKSWKTVSSGEFSNIVNSPIEQLVRFEPVNAEFIRLKAAKTADGNGATFGEVGVLTK